ncbi:hypothetical protein M407DRAFT_246112 [Tulasnella calospora MUT 4182]|uniref:Uncharacterized protein n=1 Tax=Tulasnella calospora MUT 4182 TaxID=1051891 RepID=A0A0C3Q6T8_9AGAM|nr:hypothetical protein M407DRAFT_246112 [Tulasnella calospora MUT 4182]
MYDDSYDNDGTDFWKGYDSSAAASPVLGSKATFTHIEYSPSTSFSFKPAESPSRVDVHSSTVPELVFTHHRTASSLTDTPDSHPQPLSAVEHSEEDDSSYWSQYSKVQGSGDSTVPSPRLPNGKKPELDEFGRPLFEVGDDEHTPSAVEVMQYEPTASLRGDLYLHGSVGVEDEFAEEPFGRGFDDAFADKKEDEVPEVNVMVGGLGLTTHTAAEQPEEAPLASEASDSGSSESAGSTALASETALEEAMRGIYWLWKGQNADRTVEQFLGLVKRAIDP